MVQMQVPPHKCVFCCDFVSRLVLSLCWSWDASWGNWTVLQAHQFRLSWSSLIISIFSISTFVSAVVGDNVLAIMNSPYSEYPRQLLIYLQLLLGSNFSRFFVIFLHPMSDPSHHALHYSMCLMVFCFTGSSVVEKQVIGRFFAKKGDWDVHNVF